MNVCITSVVG